MNAEGEMVYVVDDDALLRRAVTRLLKSEGFPVTAFGSAREFLAGYNTDDVACIVLDVGMPELDGMALQRRLTQSGVLAPIVFLTGQGNIPMGVHAIKSGAIDFLTKPVDAPALFHAVRLALQKAASNKVAHQTLATLTTRYSRLTPREREVMAHVVRGQLNKQIAADLNAAEQTIKIHRGRVMRKMGVESVAELVRAAEMLEIAGRLDPLDITPR